MIAIKETTGGQFPAHTYLLDGTTLVAYIKVNETEPFYFKNGIKHFDKRGRKFVEAPTKLFKVVKSDLIEVKGSKGNSYFVDAEAKTCTCPGFTFRGACKHIGELVSV
ncbi:Zinc finger, SWIM-type [uncultured Caudovirales phage]|uniref:Zinc finger, SWIM-type n=1 Tax=uncultured Caudovirales phage TaxID=2100421 RepID=A0A6J5T9Y8_9CAUD|nr:Zinc finger, SWIM-type [uncultured Caudovirales phage]